jgi:hypothetical protein
MKKLSYKRKNVFLLIGGLLLLVITWEFSFSKTWTLFTANQKMSNAMQYSQNGMKGIQNIKAEISQLNTKISRFDTSSSRQQELIGYISRFAEKENFKIIEIPKTTSEKNNGFQIETNILKVQGDYIGLVKLIYSIEYKDHLCKVAGVDFQKNINLKTHQEYLITTLYLQNIKKNKL